MPPARLKPTQQRYLASCETKHFTYWANRIPRQLLMVLFYIVFPVLHTELAALVWDVRAVFSVPLQKFAYGKTSLQVYSGRNMYKPERATCPDLSPTIFNSPAPTPLTANLLPFNSLIIPLVYKEYRGYIIFLSFQ